MKWRIVLCVALCCFSIFSNAASEYRLSNGLQLLVKQDHRSPIAIVEVWYRVGSADERLGETGISHFLEHMMFQGSLRYPPGHFKRSIAAVGGSLNAYTSRDVTVYYELVPDAALSLALHLEADRMNQIRFSKQQFKTEKQVILEERRMRVEDNPGAALLERINAAALTASPYQEPIIGWPDDLNQMSSDDLYQWYDKYDTPNNATIVVVGDVDPNTVYKDVQNDFAPLHPGVPIQRQKFMPVKPLGEKTVNVSMPTKVPVLMMAFRVPSVVSAKTPSRAYALTLLAQAMAGNASSLLVKNLVHQQMIALNIGVHYQPVSRYGGLFLISAVPVQGVSPSNLQRAIWDQLRLIKEAKLSPVVIAQAKIDLRADRLYQMDDIRSEANLLGMFPGVGMSWRESQSYLKHIDAVDAKSILALAQKYLVQSNATIGELHPSSVSGTGQQLADNASITQGVFS